MDASIGTFFLAIGLAVAVLVIGLFVARVLVRPERCPKCKVRAVHRWFWVESRPEPTPAYYRCDHCGLRLRRLFQGPWEDASATEYDVFYKDAPPLPLPPTKSYRE